MSVYSGPNITSSNIVFFYDSHNREKSWRGKPVNNYYGNISTSAGLRGFRTQHYWDGTKWIVNGIYSNPKIAGPKGVFLGLVYKHTSGALSSTWSGNSYGYTLKDIASVSGNTYTMSSWTYVSPDCNISNLPCSTEGASSNNISVSGYSSNYNLSNKGTWQQIAVSAISDGNVRWLPIYPNRVGITDGSFTGFYMWAATQVEDGTIVTRYAGDGIVYNRSSTQSILDLTGNITITTDSLTYLSDDTFSFNGSTDQLSTSTLPYQFLNTGFTVSIGLRYQQTTTNDNLISWGSNAFNGGLSYSWEIRVRGSGFVEFSPGVYTTGTVPARLTYTPSPALNGRDVIIDVSYTPNGMAYIYENGVLKGSTNYSGVGLYNNTQAIRIGRGTDTNFPGRIYFARVYNRPLTATEISKNFDSMRLRYGI